MTIRILLFDNNVNYFLICYIVTNVTFFLVQHIFFIKHILKETKTKRFFLIKKGFIIKKINLKYLFLSVLFKSY